MSSSSTLRMAVMVGMAAILPLAAQAQIGPSQGGRAAFTRFKALDSNGDRALSRAELNVQGGAKAASALFQLLDADGDGRLSLREVEGISGGARVARFDSLDGDLNGYLSRREFPAALDARLFAALDRDHDGKLSMGEIRPALGGWRQSDPKAAPPVRQARQAEESQPLCWVPNFGDADRWLIEMPVLAGPTCTTR